MIATLFALALVGWLGQVLVFVAEFRKHRDAPAFFAGFACLGWAVAFARELHLLPRAPTTWLLGAALVVAWGGLLLLLRLAGHRPLPRLLRWLRWPE